MATVRRWLNDAIWDWIFRLLAVGSLLLGAVAVLDVRALAECQAEYNEVNNRRTQLLSEPNTRFDNALIAILLDPSALIPRDERSAEDQKRLAELSQEWVAAASALKQARIDNPVPPPPSALCG